MHKCRNTSERTKYFDYLRVLATFAVVMLHASSFWFTQEEIGTTSWYISVVYNSATRWAVPVFVMISGALFLDRDMDTKKIYTKYIFRIVTAFVFWSFIYAIITDPTANVKGLIVNVLYGHYHMWFLYMIIGLYMLIPILRKITESMSVTKYFLILALIFAVVIPQIIQITNFSPQPIGLSGEMMHTVVGKLNINLFGGFVGYFLAGYYLNTIEISLKWRRSVWLLGTLGYIATVVCTVLLCIYQKEPNELFFGSFTINTVMFTVGRFVYAKYKFEHSKVLRKIDGVIVQMAKYSFGAYLAHALILSKLMELVSFKVTPVNTIIFIPVISVVVFCVSMGISMFLSKIPILKKYIV